MIEEDDLRLSNLAIPIRTVLLDHLVVVAHDQKWRCPLSDEKRQMIFSDYLQDGGSRHRAQRETEE
jgi:hypothetical protein